MLCFLIPVFVALILVAFLFFKDEKFQYLIKGDSTGGGKADDMYSKIEKLEKEEVDFLYDSIRQSLNQTFSLRDGENKTILSHSAFFCDRSGIFLFFV